MKPIKRYTAIMITTSNIDDVVIPNLSYGRIEGPYYSQTYPTESFDTEEEAIEYCYKTDKWANWLIIPVIGFDNFD